MEMAQELLKHCPDITITLNIDPAPDYALLLNRETLGIFGEGVSQIMLVRGSDKNVLYANKKGTVSKAVRDGCKAILSDWKQTHALPASTHDLWQSTKPESSK